MNSLLRFLIGTGLIVTCVWGGLMALVVFIKPQPREMSHIISLEEVRH